MVWPTFVGDSLALAREAVKVDADVIVLGRRALHGRDRQAAQPGGKTVLIPEAKAGCSLAESITPGRHRAAARRAMPACRWSPM